MNTHNDPVLTVVFLFLLGLISPGPNFLVVVQATLNWGRLAGFLTGLGAATGDALYATCGLFGVAELIETNRGLMMSIRILGGLYLIWIGIQMLHRRRSSEQYRHRSSHSHNLGLQHFVRGLATDLANPKTVVFFASIFATTLEPDTPHEVRIKMLFGIVLTSIAWRFCLTVVFSNSLFRSIYERREQAIQRAFGLLICLFGAHLLTRSA